MSEMGKTPAKLVLMGLFSYRVLWLRRNWVVGQMTGQFRQAARREQLHCGFFRSRSHRSTLGFRVRRQNGIQGQVKD